MLELPVSMSFALSGNQSHCHESDVHLKSLLWFFWLEILKLT
jgi:hypothetical protein